MAKLKPEQLKALDELYNEVLNEVDVVKQQDKLDNVLSKFIKKIKNNLKKDGSNASGKLSASIQPLPTLSENGKLTYRIELEDYWKDVDEGTEPKGFSIEKRNDLQPKIMKWIQNKPQLQAQVEAKKRKSLSYAIATTILKKGTIKRYNYSGSQFLSREIDMFEKHLIKVIEEE